MKKALNEGPEENGKNAAQTATARRRAIYVLISFGFRICHGNGLNVLAKPLRRARRIKQ